MKKLKEYQTLLGLVIIAVSILTSSLIVDSGLNKNIDDLRVQLNRQLNYIGGTVTEVRRELWCQRIKNNGEGC